MELLSALGVNSTLWIHLALFFIAFGFLSQLVFKPYSQALELREKKTGGADKETTELLLQVSKINQDYELRARALNASIRSEYDKFKQEAAQIANAKTAQAREQAAEVALESRALIQAEIIKARAALAKELPSVKAEIVGRLAGKEISA